MPSAELHYADPAALGIVLIHGAGLGGFIWQPLKPLLAYPSLATNFPNRGDQSRKNSKLSFADYCDTLTGQIDGFNAGRLVIVGHSIGGCIALQLADRLGPRVVGFVALGAAIPVEGGVIFVVHAAGPPGRFSNHAAACRYKAA